MPPLNEPDCRRYRRRLVCDRVDIFFSCGAGWQPAAGWLPAWSAGCQPARRLPICPTIERYYTVEALAHLKRAEHQARIPWVAGRAEDSADFHRDAHLRLADRRIGQCEHQLEGILSRTDCRGGQWRAVHRYGHGKRSQAELFVRATAAQVELLAG